MNIQFGFARTEIEKEGVYRNRHIVFVEEEGHMPPRPDRRLVDAYDALPTTVNAFARVDGRIIGSLRFTRAGRDGMPASAFFDFTPHLPADIARVGCCSQSCIQRAYRGRTITFYLFALGYNWCVKQGLTHVICVINPTIRAFVNRQGYRALGPQQHHAGKQLDFVPMILKLSDLGDRFHQFFAAQDGDTFTLPAVAPLAAAPSASAPAS